MHCLMEIDKVLVYPTYTPCLNTETFTATPKYRKYQSLYKSSQN